MEAIVKTKKIGGSIMVRIPKEITESAEIGANQIVRISIEKVRKSGFGMAKGIGSFRHEKVSDFD